MLIIVDYRFKIKFIYISIDLIGDMALKLLATAFPEEIKT